MNTLQSTTLIGLGLGLALHGAPAGAWWQSYYQTIPYGPTPWAGPYPAAPWIPTFGPDLSALWNFLAPLSGLGRPQFWQYPIMPYGPMNYWSGTIPMSGLFVQQGETPAGYQILVQTGQPGAPTIDIGVQGGVLTIRTQAQQANSGAGNAMQMQSGWSTRMITLPPDANFAAMQMQRGNGVVEIFIPRTY